jgi:Cu/Ag efflux protein CusF
MNRPKILLAVSAAMLLILAAGCGSAGDILGGNNPSNGPYTSSIRGTVESVDTYGHSINLINTSGYNSMLSGTNGNGGTLRVYYDNNTTVTYNGQNFRPENLERGDQVEIQAAQNGNQLIAQSMTVTYNANATASSQYPSSQYPSSSNPNGTYNSTITGTVRNVNTSARTITIDRGYNQTSVIEYDPNTSVSYNGRTYMPSDLEPGDQVSISVRDFGGGRVLAQNVSVTRSVSSSNNGTYGNSSQYSTIRGTVQYVDTNARTITLNSTTWTNGFLPGYGGNNSTITIRYDSGMNVNVNGQTASISGLERGDVVDVQVRDLGNSNLVAQNITLVRDVRR